MRYLAHLRPAALCALAACSILVTGCGRGGEGTGSSSGGDSASSPGITKTEIKLGASIRSAARPRPTP
jgi:hypothetical protein